MCATAFADSGDTAPARLPNAAQSAALVYNVGCALGNRTLAVSLGGTETLICHPGSTTHAAVDRELQQRLGFDPGMVRVSIGVENPDDLIADFEQALKDA